MNEVKEESGGMTISASVEKPKVCVSCGIILDAKSTGRPRQRCELCNQKYRKEYQAKQWQKRRPLGRRQRKTWRPATSTIMSDPKMRSKLLQDLHKYEKSEMCQWLQFQGGSGFSEPLRFSKQKELQLVKRLELCIVKFNLDFTPVWDTDLNKMRAASIERFQVWLKQFKTKGFLLSEHYTERRKPHDPEHSISTTTPKSALKSGVSANAGLDCQTCNHRLCFWRDNNNSECMLKRLRPLWNNQNREVMKEPSHGSKGEVHRELCEDISRILNESVEVVDSLVSGNQLTEN